MVLKYWNPQAQRWRVIDEIDKMDYYGLNWFGSETDENTRKENQEIFYTKKNDEVKYSIELTREMMAFVLTDEGKTMERIN